MTEAALSPGACLPAASVSRPSIVQVAQPLPTTVRGGSINPEVEYPFPEVVHPARLGLANASLRESEVKASGIDGLPATRSPPGPA
jgi:hypothetical protein